MYTYAPDKTFRRNWGRIFHSHNFLRRALFGLWRDCNDYRSIHRCYFNFMRAEKAEWKKGHVAPCCSHLVWIGWEDELVTFLHPPEVRYPTSLPCCWDSWLLTLQGQRYQNLNLSPNSSSALDKHENPLGAFQYPSGEALSSGFRFVWGRIRASAFSKSVNLKGDAKCTGHLWIIWELPLWSLSGSHPLLMLTLWLSVPRWLKMGEASTVPPESWELCERAWEGGDSLMGVNPVSWNPVWWCASRGHPRNTVVSAICC